MQKALDSLLQIYLQKETTSNSSNIQHGNKQKEEIQFGIENCIQPHEEEELLYTLYQCLEEKGVMKEVQAFLRQKLINILKGVWPNLVSNSCEGNLGQMSMTLIEDFMCCHKLLFTYSVLATELDKGYTFKGNFGKMPFATAEIVLNDIGIKKNSKLNRKILTSYSENDNWSLLECIIDSNTWTSYTNVEHLKLINSNGKQTIQSLDEKMKVINDKYHDKNLKIKNRNTTIEEKLQNLTEAMEIDKEAQLEIRMERFRQEEISKIKDEIETKLKFEILQKEKDLLKNFENQVIHLKRNLKREKQLWIIERNQKEKELSETRKELVKALMILQTDENMKNNFTRKDIKLMDGEVVEELNLDVAHETVNTKIKTPEKMSNSPGKRSDILSAFIMKKELERQFLLKEASLRSSIDKLKAENLYLKEKSLIPTEIIQVPMTRDLPLEVLYDRWQEIAQPARLLPPNPEKSKQNPYVDTIALMQYKIESQSEEIEKLRQTNNESMRLESKNSQNPKFEEVDLELDTFLEESRRRLCEIEKEVKSVELSVNVIQRNKPTLVQGQAHVEKSIKFGPEIPKLPPPYPKSLFVESNLKKYEYFPKYLYPEITKPRPITAYKPVLGSVSVPVDLGLQKSLPKQAVSTEFVSTKPTDLFIDQANNDAQFYSKPSSSMENISTRVPTQSLTKKFQKDLSQIDTSEIKLNSARTRVTETEFRPIEHLINTKTTEIDNQNQKLSPLMKSNPEMTNVSRIQPFQLKNSENTNFSVKTEKLQLQMHQEKANTSGALVKDKLSTSDKSEIDGDLSLRSNHSSLIEVQKPILQLTWREILNSNTNLVENNQNENIEDIGPLETGDPDDVEDFWEL